MRFLINALFFLGLCSLYNGAFSAQCDISEQKNAFKYFRDVESFQDFYIGYREFNHCDDGFIADEISSTVVRLIKLDLMRFISNSDSLSDKGYVKFVLLHVDEMMTKADLREIDGVVRSACAEINGNDDVCFLLREKISYLGGEEEQREEEQEEQRTRTSSP